MANNNDRESRGQGFNREVLSTSGYKVSSSRGSGKKGKKKSSSNKSKWILRGCFALCAIILVAVFVSYVAADVNFAGEQLIATYNSIGGKVTDSKEQFSKKLEYLNIYTNEKGEYIVGIENGGTTSGAGATTESNPSDSNITNTESNPSGSGTSIQLSADSEKVKQILSDAGYTKAAAMAYAYELMNPLLGTNAAIGLMANIQAEGDYGIVEYAFSQAGNHYYEKHNFRLPSGGSKVKTKADIEYLLSEPWDTITRHPYGDGNCSPASCGLGMIQWSGSRRKGVAQKYLETLNGSNTITEEIMEIAECSYMCQELQPSTSYYASVSRLASTSNTCEDWAEAFCDTYERPTDCCGAKNAMAGTGGQCKARRAEAARIASILGGL